MQKIVICLIIVLLAGCAVGQRIDYTRVTPEIVNKSKGDIAVGAQDRRQYIISGQKKQQFVGLMRGGFGNPFDVNTASGSPFAKDVAEVLSRAMKRDGVKVVELNLVPSANREEIIGVIKSAKVDSAIVLTINEWKTDAMMSASVSYDLVLEEFDREGRLLRHSQSHGTDELGSLAFSFDPASVVAKAATGILQKSIEEMYSSLSNVDLKPGIDRKNVSDQLKELNQLLEQGMITQVEYNQKRKEIIDRF